MDGEKLHVTFGGLHPGPTLDQLKMLNSALFPIKYKVSETVARWLQRKNHCITASHWHFLSTKLQMNHSRLRNPTFNQLKVPTSTLIPIKSNQKMNQQKSG
jgi:hypothetical protein